MLGTVADAEDMLQEAFIRWQESAEEPESPRAFLVTIISRLCINYLQSARAQREEYVGQWLPEPVATGSDLDPIHMIKVDESLSMAFLVVLERLTPIERCVFLLREVFEYEYDEIAAVLNQTPTNCRQILHRARQHISASRPRFVASIDKKNELLEQFQQATFSGDPQALLRILSEDVVLYSDGGGKGPAVPNVVHGADKVARGIIGAQKNIVPANLVRRVTYINGEPGIVAYLDGKPFSAITITCHAGHIREIYIVSNPDKLSHVPELSAIS
jgi:RNA polymerase sigma-70 factor, ECF subfamily